MEKNKVTVYICGNEYTIVSEEEQQHLMGISEHVSTLMKDLRYKNPMLNTEKAAVLTALNICDDYYKLYKDKDELTVQLDEMKKREEEFDSKLDGKDDYAESLKNQINERISQSESLKKQIEELRNQLEKKTEYAERIKSELQDKTRQAEELKREKQEFDSRYEELRAENEELDTGSRVLNIEIGNLKAEINELRALLAEKEGERENQLQKKVLEYASELEKAQKRIKELEKSRQMVLFED